MADIFLSYLKKLGIEENFRPSKDGLDPSSDCMKATLLSNQVISHYSSSLEYHLTRKDSSIFQKEAFEDPSGQKQTNREKCIFET